MMDTECVVLYTHQKQKKAKTWHDGVLKVLTPGTRAILYDDKKTKIDTVHIKPESIVSGEQLESDRHLILIEEIRCAAIANNGQIAVPCGQTTVHEPPVVRDRPNVSTTSAGAGRLSMRAGLKRRKTGFVPPRMMKQPRLDVGEGPTDDLCRDDYTNPVVGSNPPLFKTTERSPDTAGILNLYSRIGAAKPSVSDSASTIQSNTGQLVGGPFVLRENVKQISPLLGQPTKDESPGSSFRSPWTSFGAGRVGHKGGDSPKDGGSYKQLGDGNQSSHQNSTKSVDSRTANLCERNLQNEQTCCGEKDWPRSGSNAQSDFANVLTGSSKRASDINTGASTTAKRSATQIMALLGKSNSKESVQTEDVDLSRNNSQNSSRSSSSPVYLHSSLKCPTNNTCYSDRHDHKSSTDIQQSSSGKEFCVLNNPASVYYHKEIQDQVEAKTSSDETVHDSSGDIDFSFSSNNIEINDKHMYKQRDFPGKLTPENTYCNSVGDVRQKQCDFKENQFIKDTFQDDVLPSQISTKQESSSKDFSNSDLVEQDKISFSSQSSLNEEASSKDFLRSDLITQEKIENISQHLTNQHDCENSLPLQEPHSNKEMRNESTNENLTEIYDHSDKEKVDEFSSDDDLEFENDNTDAGQRGSFLISYSPLSQVSNSEDECDFLNSNSTAVDPKQNLKEEGEIIQSQETKGSQSKPDRVKDDNRSMQDEADLDNYGQQDKFTEDFQLQQDPIEKNSTYNSQEDQGNKSQQWAEGSKGILSQQEEVSHDCRLNQENCKSQTSEGSETQLHQDLEHSGKNQEQNSADCLSQQEQISDGSQLHEDKVSEDCESHQEQISDGSQLHEDKVSEDCESHQEQISDGSQLHEDKVSEDCESHQGQIFYGPQLQEDKGSEDCESHQEQISDGSQLHEDKVSEDCESHQEQISDGPQLHQDTVSEDCESNQDQALESSQLQQQDQVMEVEIEGIDSQFIVDNSKGGNSMEIVDCEIEVKDEWTEKAEILSKIDISKAYIQLTGRSADNSSGMRNSQTSELDTTASQSSETGKYFHNTEEQIVHSATTEKLNSLNDLNFSQDSVTFSSLSCLEGRDWSDKLDVRTSTWQTKQTIPDRHSATDNIRLSQSNPQKISQRFTKVDVPFSQSKGNDAMTYFTVMKDITNIIPENTKQLCNKELKVDRFSNSPFDSVPSDVSELEMREKPDSLHSSGHHLSNCKELSTPQENWESESQFESLTEELSGNVTSLSHVCHSSGNLGLRGKSDVEMLDQYDTTPFIQEQQAFTETIISTRYKKPSSLEENCLITEEPLPHPSQLRGRSNMYKPQTSNIAAIDLEDPFTDRIDQGPIENATQRLEHYKVRGSVSGSMVRRVNKSRQHCTTSPSLSEDLRTQRSPSQTLENPGYLADQDDHSLFIDWNVGKPKLVDMNTLCNTRDIKIPGSPYQYVPTVTESPQGGYDDGVDVPDIDFDEPRSQATPEIATRHFFSEESSPSVLSPDLHHVPSRSTRLPFEMESPTYGNMFREKRNMVGGKPDSKVTQVCNNIEKNIVGKTCKEKTSLKCKPFQDFYTHTSYTSKYFTPSVDFREKTDNSTNLDNNIANGVNSTKSLQDDIPADEDLEFHTDDTTYPKQPCKESQLDRNEVDSNREPFRDECDKKVDLQLSLSSVGSSDLELSFTLTDYNHGQSKPHGGREDQLCTQDKNSDLRSWNTSDVTRNCEVNVPSRTFGGHNSKWGRFIMEEEEDDELIFDGSFDEHYNARKVEERVQFKTVSPQIATVNTSYKIPETKSQLPCYESNSSENISHSGQKPYVSIPSAQKQTMLPLSTNHSLNPASNLPLHQGIPGGTDVSSTIENSHDVFMDDFDVHDTEGMTSCSGFPNPNSATKHDVHRSRVPFSTAAVTAVDKQSVRSTTSPSVITARTFTAASKLDVFPSGEKAKTLGQSHIPVADECDRFSTGQNVMKKFRSPLPNLGLLTHVLKGSKRSLSGDLQFASKEEIDNNPVPLRELSITVNFPNVAVYKQVLTAVLKEHLNIILFELAQQYHRTLGMADISNYIPSQPSGPTQNKSASVNQASANPSCQCGVPSKMVQVKKAGNNKGRFFFACNATRNKQCKFFQWVDQAGGGGGRTSTPGGNRLKLCDVNSINTYMRGNHLMLYCECVLLKKADFVSHFKQGVPNWVKMKYGQANQDKKKLYIKLSKKDASSMYSKDDLWIISTTLNFLPSQTFLAKSAYFGPNSANELEIEPVAGFSPSNWPNHASCHALLAGNIASELCYLSNIEENMSPMSLPILPWILDRSPLDSQKGSSQQRGFKAPVRTAVSEANMFASKTSTMELAEEFIQRFSLNTDQTSALIRVCNLFCGGEDGQKTDPILLIHGVFGAGKSFLLSVVVLFLVRLFEVSDSYTPGVPYPWKILISSNTNVAVDRILLGLLNIGFEDFVRVGSMKKIAKPVLPFSVHATGSESQELKDLQEMLRSGELTPSEKHNVRQSIEKHRLGENKKRLSNVRVVGVTCASCTASSLDRMSFPVVLLDESSQMTEPSSMLPVAKFGCEKLLLVGDPKQLDPTIKGVEAAHTNGLEQTLFDRLMKMGHRPTVLYTQYRCHPVISNLANTLFYDGRLINGVTTADRQPLVPDVPTLCFFDVSKGQEQSDDGGSYYNEKEADFVTSLIKSLLERGVEPGSIGVITLYKSQMYKINTSLLTNIQNDSSKEIKATRVSTVDAFQGGEHDIIILSCVRTKGVGFIDNHKRTNVALTRARHHLLIVGKKSNLSQNLLWGKVLQLCGGQPGGVCDADNFLNQLRNTEQVLLQDEMRTPCSPPMSLSSQDTNSIASQHDKENNITEVELSPLVPSDSPVAPVRKKCRLINADLLDCSEVSDSDEELPSL
ncbi:uncharacterized protein [Argopecten irradians]|uniref:uncharacterized protein n=1 Tax=Argopecten irradians TaxID=31199 RepID=UPI003721675B